MTTRQEFALAFQAALNVSRQELYGEVEDRQVPKSLADAAQTPYLGFVGSGYKTGGTCLIAANPGGGGDGQEKTDEDAALEKRIFALQGALAGDAEKALADVTADYFEQLKIINLRKIVKPVLVACKSDITDVAFLNIFPYRTLRNTPPSSKVLRRSIDLIVRPLVDLLAPSRIVFLGLGVAKIAYEPLNARKKYVVERTIGDSRLCDNAKEVLRVIETDRA